MSAFGVSVIIPTAMHCIPSCNLVVILTVAHIAAAYRGGYKCLKILLHFRFNN